MADTPHYVMAVDVERCTGCHACSVACKVENDVPLGNFRTKVYYHDAGKFPTVTRSFLPVVCQQCKDAPCLNACPTKSITRGEDGIVRIDQHSCDGNGDCVDACPYGAIYLDPILNVADKCSFCDHRLAVGMEPACVETCPSSALIFGDTKIADSPISKFLAKHDGKLDVLKPEKGTQPQVSYRGLNREMEKKIPEGRNHDPRSYEIETWAALQATFDSDDVEKQEVQAREKRKKRPRKSKGPDAK